MDVKGWKERPLENKILLITSSVSIIIVGYAWLVGLI